MSIDDSADKLGPYIEEMKMNYPVLQGLGHDDVQDAFGPMLGIPVSVMISREGKICATHTGPHGKETFEGNREIEGAACAWSHSTDLPTPDPVAMPAIWYDDAPDLKGFTHARLACGCRIAFREGVEGSPVTVIVDEKSPACSMPLHVRDLPLYDYREALRPSTRLGPPEEEEYEEEG